MDNHLDKLRVVIKHGMNSQSTLKSLEMRPRWSFWPASSTRHALDDGNGRNLNKSLKWIFCVYTKLLFPISGKVRTLSIELSIK